MHLESIQELVEKGYYVDALQTIEKEEPTPQKGTNERFSYLVLDVIGR